MKIVLCIILLTLSFLANAEIDDYPMCKLVGKRWVWFSDHAVGAIKYYIVVETGKKVSVGTGMKIFDKPRGSIVTVSDEKMVNAYGLGSLHIQSYDSSPVKVCVNSGDAVPITVIRKYF